MSDQMSDQIKAEIEEGRGKEEISSPPPTFYFDHSLPDHKGRSLEDMDGVTPTCFITGQAGTGKTSMVRQVALDDSLFGIVTATTGVAAVNLGGITLHSALGFSTVEVLRDNYIAGYLGMKLRELQKAGYRWLIVDEGSMLNKKVLDYIMLGLRQINENHPDEQPLGLMIIADFGQLPPIGDVMYKDGKPIIVRGREQKERDFWL